jgi:Na+/H+-dicarboxylate symporter
MRGAPLYKNLYFQIIVGVVLGIFVGHLWPAYAVPCQLLADIFIKSLKMMVGTIVFCTMVSGICSNRGSSGKIGRTLLKSILLFQVFTAIAMSFGLLSILVFHPGTGMNVNPATLNVSAIAQYSSTASHASFHGFILSLIPSTYIGSLTQGDILPVLVVAFLTGFGLNMIGSTAGPVLQLIESFTKVIFAIFFLILKIAPLCAFGAMAFTVGKYGLHSLIPLGKLILAFYVACFLFVFVGFGLIARIYGLRIWHIIRYLREEMWITFGASGNEPAMPGLMKKCVQLGCDRGVVGMVIPTAYSFNLDGSAIYLSFASIFIAQACNIHLSWGRMALMLGILLLCTKGFAGVSGAGFVALIAGLSIVQDVPIAGVTLLIGVDRFLSLGRALICVPGHALGAILVSKWENSCDINFVREELRTRSLLSADAGFDLTKKTSETQETHGLVAMEQEAK